MNVFVYTYIQNSPTPSLSLIYININISTCLQPLLPLKRTLHNHHIEYGSVSGNTPLTDHAFPVSRALPAAEIQAPTGTSPVAGGGQPLRHKTRSVPMLRGVGPIIRAHNIGVVRVDAKRHRFELGTGEGGSEGERSAPR